MSRDPKHIQQLETAPHVKAKFPIDVDPLRWARAVLAPDVYIPALMPPSHGKLYARVNWSRWIVDCPFCKAAQDASRQHPIFWCAECGMDQNGDAPMAVIFPPNADQIEQILMQRPEAKTRNWYPSETLNDLINENRAHGIGA